MAGLDFTRTEGNATVTRTLDDYTPGGTSDPLTVAHAPVFEEDARDIARAIQLGDDAPTDPMERAKIMIDLIAEIRDQWTPDALREATEMESHLRSGRAPPAPDAPSDEARMAAAQAALSGGGSR